MIKEITLKMKLLKSIVFLSVGILLPILVKAQTASIKINKDVTFQKITGFGGFVCSPTFGYNYMSTSEISKIWGKNSEAGYNIMRLYIPIGEASWSQSLATAQYAKSLGIKIFASPWSMPATWKTNNNIAAVYTDTAGVKQIGYLKEEYYDDYANYLNNYVTYLRTNGVELDAISLQNEPDMEATYAGCIWTPTQMANFIKRYASVITCKIIAPESVGITDNYANAFVEDSVTAELDIFGGHQYGSIQTGLNQLRAKGKEVWMTEYLINWNADENTTRNFNWTTDGFSFANKLNTAMVANVNAWIHYASKRYYGLLGDGSNGSTTGVITKRGYILSHFAKYTIGATRIENTWNDATNTLKGSSYLSVSGDSIIVMVINSSANSYSVTVDLPFYTTWGKSITTTALVNMSDSSITIPEETCRPKITISASSFTTLLFTKSSNREASKMTGAAVHYNAIENQVPTSAAFGTTYKMSGKTKTFDHSNYLISANTTSGNGYLALDDRYNKLVMHINTITSALNYNASNTTLYYINKNGTASSHNYGTINFDQNGNYDWVLDISPSDLTDGCKGILGISNGNWSSILTITFGDVYFAIGSEKAYKFAGIYSKGDSYLLDCLEDVNYTSLDFTTTDSISPSLDWNATAANKNCIFYTNVANNTNNVISGTSCSNLLLSDQGGNFNVPFSFTATNASYSRTISGYEILVLPFEASIPVGIKAFTIEPAATEVNCNQITTNVIPANTPVLIEGTGTFNFEGSGPVSTPHALTVNSLNGVYISVKAPAGNYYLNSVGGVPAFYKVSSGSEPTIKPFGAYLASTSTATSLPININFVTSVKQLKNNVETIEGVYYDFYGRRIEHPIKGHMYIKNGKKIIY